jgi:hypothetical protein
MKSIKNFLILLLTPLIYLVSIITMVCLTALTIVTHIFKKRNLKLTPIKPLPFEEWEAIRIFLDQYEIVPCESCTQWLRGSFPSEQDYLELDSAIKDGAFMLRQTIPGGFTKPKREILGVGLGVRTFFGADVYVCPRCQQVWELSSPDMAYRGYFRPIRTK